MPNTTGFRCVCNGCWKVDTANLGRICTHCLKRGITTPQPRPARVTKVKRKPKRIPMNAAVPPKPRPVYKFLFG